MSTSPFLNPEALGRHVTEGVKQGVSQGDRDFEKLSELGKLRVRVARNTKAIQQVLLWVLPALAAACTVTIRWPHLWYVPVLTAVFSSFVTLAIAQRFRDQCAAELVKDGS